MEYFLSGVVGCIAVDLVHILQRMRVGEVDWHMTASGIRANSVPAYYEALTLQFYFEIDSLLETKLARALSMSINKYCSAVWSLHANIVIVTTLFNHQNQIHEFTTRNPRH